MKKIIIIAIACIVVFLAVFSVLSYMRVQEEKYIENLNNSINELLNNEEFVQVFSIYNGEEDKYKQHMDIQIEDYAQKLCDVAVEELSLDKIIRFRDAGGNYVIVSEAINQIENILTELNISAERYKTALTDYENRDFDKSRVGFEAVIENDENYQNTLQYIKELNVRDTSWTNNSFGKSSFLNACTFDGNHLYIPFILDGIDGIYKLRSNGEVVAFFPLSNEAGRLVISSINVVGDYIYFIAGENVGSGYTFANPYCIYEMKTDGTGLTVAAEGNFTDLFIKEDMIYAISREYGLIEFDKCFANSTVISYEDVIEFSWSENGLYYTVRESLEFDSFNTVYLYDGQNSTAIYNDEHMHYFNFGDRYLKWWATTASGEALYLGNSQEEIRVIQKDINVVYGIVDDTVLYSTYGKWQQEYVHFYSIETAQIQVKNSYDKLFEYKTLGIFYEEEKLIIEMNGALYFSNAAGDNITEIAVPSISDNMLNVNMEQIKHIDQTDIYLDEGDEPIISVISDKQYWHYKDAYINLYIEKRYMEQYDTCVYVTHIFTNDYSLFKTGNGSGYDNAIKTFRASDISDKYQMIYAQNGDTFLDGRNINRGIIIRNGRVLRKALLYDMLALFDDGTMEIYRGTDNVTGEELVEAGAMMSFSFGPVLVEDYQVLTECAFDALALRNPRSAMGYVEPGHYVSIVCDGRDEKVSRGLSMIQLAIVFEEEGCRLAYNLDGGTTSTITFLGNYITRRTAYPDVPEIYNHRKVAELFYIGTSELSPLDLSEYTYEYAYYAENIK